MIQASDMNGRPWWRAFLFCFFLLSLERSCAQPILSPTSLIPTTDAPTKTPTPGPTKPPTPVPTKPPTPVPTKPPTPVPTKPPTPVPTKPPTRPPTPVPTKPPTPVPTKPPTPVPTKPPTPVPTKPPTPVPTKPPTPVPTKPPTPVPTKPPTPVPTKPPTRVPTKPPTPVPTKPPTPVPTKPPTPVPTKPPTRPPTPVPTKPPTPVPTKPPTPVPTKQPTPVPTKPPTPVPTKPPTPVPTKPPTASPSELPSRSPSELPTELPSISPTSVPSVTPGSPTLYPSSLPSSNPSISLQPSTLPSLMPSDYPSATPSVSLIPSMSSSGTPSVSDAPSVSPAPSNVPSGRPSLAPTDLPSSSPTWTVQNFLIEVTMVLKNTTGILSGTSIIRFESESYKAVKKALDNVVPAMDNLRGGVNIKEQKEVSQNRLRLLRATDTNMRFLQQDSSPHEIVFDLSIDFISTKMYEEKEINLFVGTAFTDDFVSSLKSTDPTIYKDFETGTVEIGGIVITDPPTASPTSAPEAKESGFPVVIVAASAGGAAFLLLVGFLVYRPCSGSNNDAFANNSKAGTRTIESPQNMVQNVFINPDDDISTLGDPMYVPSGAMLGGHGSLEREETVNQSIISGDYDYAKAYGDEQTPPSVSTATVDKDAGPAYENSSLFSDDASFEQQYDETEEQYQVEAPSGKLGIVIDTPSGGVPVVHAIKDTSVLAGSVHVGDRLMSVDGEDTTVLTAMQVSKLIASKSNQSSRTLLFVRSLVKNK